MPKTRKNGYVEYLVIAFFFGLATGIIARGKGSSFWIWFVIGAVLPRLGLVAAILYRVEKNEPERAVPDLPQGSSSSTSRSARAAGRTSTCRTRRRSGTRACD